MNGEGGTEWPSDPGPPGGFEDGSGGGNQPPAGESGANPGSVTPPPAGQPPAGAAPAGGGQPGANEPPAGRFDELNGRFTALEQKFGQTEAENRRLKQVIAQLSGIEPPKNPAAPPDPRLERMKGVLLQIFPELANLSQLAQHTHQTSQEREREQNAFAVRTLKGVFDHAAPQLLGEGKTAKDLPKHVQIWLKDSFITWVTSDPAREERYDQGDTAGMAAEFWNDYNAAMRATSVRVQNAGEQQRGQRRANLPQQGSSAAPVGTPPPNLNLKDEDAVHKAGWAFASGGRP